ncbi:MAG: hypothetical protein AAGE13_03420 [Pseudomonadota bacterium]
MSRTRWVRRDIGGTTRIAAHSARGWDLTARGDLPETGAGSDPRFRARLAHQIRKDLWRLLRGLRGFAPMVEIEFDAGKLSATAGGSLLAGPAPAGTAAQIADLLADPQRQRRWLAFAARVGHAPPAADRVGHPHAL